MTEAECVEALAVIDQARDDLTDLIDQLRRTGASASPILISFCRIAISGLDGAHNTISPAQRWSTVLPEEENQ